MNGRAEIPAGEDVTVTVECAGCPDAPDDEVLYRIGQLASGMFQRVGPKWGVTIESRYWQVSAARSDGSAPDKAVLYDVGRNLPRHIAEHR